MSTVTITGGDKLEAKLKEIADRLGSGKATLRVGFLEGSTYPDGTSVPLVAAVQEFGAPSKGIPPRPFMRTTVSEHSGDWPKALEGLLKDNGYDLRKSLGMMGEGIKGQIQQSIATWSAPPNAPSTIRKKGFDAPLRDTAHMLNSVDYEVVQGDQEEQFQNG